MTPTIEAQWPNRPAAGSLATRLVAFHLRLTPDEQRELDMALRHTAAAETATTEDTTGHIISVGHLPLIAVKVIEQLRQQPAQSAQRH